MTAQETSIARVVCGKGPHRWRKHEDDILRRLNAEGKTDRQIAEVLGLTRSQVSEHRRHLGLTTVYARRWTEEMSARLSHLVVVEGLSYAKAAKVLGVTESAAKHHGSSTLGLVSPYMWLPCEVDFLREHWGKEKQTWIAKKIGKTPGAIANKAKAMGLHANRQTTSRTVRREDGEDRGLAETATNMGQ